jgi:C4-dicarboxylate transporter
MYKGCKECKGQPLLVGQLFTLSQLMSSIEVRSTMKRLHYVVLAGGLVWLGAVLWLVSTNVVAREIRPIGVIAALLDRLPSIVGTPLFILLWFIFLLGWIVLLVFGVPTSHKAAKSD